MSETNFAALVEPIARHFWGEPNKALSTKTELRWGSQGSRAVFLDGPGNWKDFETDVGGGVIDLVMTEGKCTKAEAIAWLEGEDFIEKREQSHSGSSGRQEARPVEHVPQREETPASEPAPEGKPTAVKGYRYTDGDGNPLYEVIRYQFKLPDGSWLLNSAGNPKKTFRQRRPDGRGGYLWNLDGVGHTIYRRQEVDIAIAEGRAIFLVEGEKDVETLEAWGLVATTNSGGAKHWTPDMAKLLTGADVVIIPDNDDAGREGAELKAKSLKGIARRIRMLDLAAHVPGLPPKGDVTDWREQMGGTASKLGEILNTLPDYRPRPPQSKFNAMAVKDAIKFAGDHEWLVDDLIELHGTASFSGNSQSGKTFQVIELAFCVATGRNFWGRKVKQGLVVYQVGEGEEGFMKRLAGYFKDRGIDDMSDLPIVILPKKINLFAADDDATNLIAEAKAWEEYYGIPLRLVVIDTFNKATRGANEISGQDIGKINERLERIQAECRCCVAVVDHLSKGGTVRGHGSKTGDITNMILVEKDERKVDNNGRAIRRMKLDKNKDGENGGIIQFVLRQVVVGFKEDGKAITTCVVEPPDGNEEELEKSGRLPLNQATILRVLRDTIEIEGEPPSVGVQSGGRSVVTWKAFVAAFERKWQFSAPESEPEQRKAEVHRIMKDAGRKLQLAGYIDRDNAAGVIWWTGRLDRPMPKPRPLDPAPGLSPEIKADLAEAPF